MANFEKKKNLLEGIINSQLNATRQDQGTWEWFNALQRIVSQQRIGGEVGIYGPAEALDADFVAVTAGAATLWGALVDNSNAAEAVFVSILDGGAGLTPGTEHIPGHLAFVPAATMRTFLYPQGVAYATSIAVYAGTGTSAGLEAGTGVTGVNPTIVLVYTSATGA